MNQSLGVVNAVGLPPDDKSDLASLTTAERRALVRRHPVIPTERFREISRCFSELMTPEMSSYPLSYLLVGESGTGKTTLLNTFADKHAATFDTSREQDVRKVVSFEMPVAPTLATFYNALIDAMGYEGVRVSSDRRTNFAMDRLSALGTRAIIVDEVQHILRAGTQTKQALMDTLKVIASKGYAVIASGTLEARAAFQSNPQVNRRFETVTLSPFDVDEEYRRLLVTIERALPLRGRSGLADRDIARELHAMSHGLLGQLWRIIERATLLAIDKGEESITLEILKRSSPARV